MRRSRQSIGAIDWYGSASFDEEIIETEKWPYSFLAGTTRIVQQLDKGSVGDGIKESVYDRIPLCASAIWSEVFQIHIHMFIGCPPGRFAGQHVDKP